jgi:hypothetical protein
MIISLKIEARIMQGNSLEERDSTMKFNSSNEWLKSALPESYDKRNEESKRKAEKARRYLPAYANVNTPL